MSSRKTIFLLLAIIPTIAAAQAIDLNEYLSTEFPGKVLSVKVTENKVIIKGRRPAGRNFYLSEVSPWENLDPEGLKDNPYKLCFKKFRRSIPRKTEKDGIVYDRALSRWAIVKIEKDAAPALCSHARYADEIYPVRSADPVPLTGKKGLGGYRLNKFQDDIDKMGIRSVTINIHLNSLLYASQRPGTFLREYGGVKYWFDSTKVDYLDRVLKYCTDRGVVTSAITLTAPILN